MVYELLRTSSEHVGTRIQVCVTLKVIFLTTALCLDITIDINRTLSVLKAFLCWRPKLSINATRADVTHTIDILLIIIIIGLAQFLFKMNHPTWTELHQNKLSIAVTF